MRHTWVIEFYETAAGQSPVADAAEDLLDAKGRARLAAAVDVLAEHGLSLGFPHVRLLRGWAPLRELRVTYRKREFRLVFFPRNATLVAVHFFQKQSKRTPNDILQTSRGRMKDWLERQN